MPTAPSLNPLTSAAAAFAIALLPSIAFAQPCPAGRFLLLTNGKIHTMDAKRTVVSKVRIANGKFAEVDDAASAAGGCTDTIDLRGRTVIPGMIDNHFHVQLVGSRPGYETRTIETAFSIAEVQDVIRERATSVRSEEHTSELQSLAYLVCRLLLEKKKNKRNKTDFHS